MWVTFEPKRVFGTAWSGGGGDTCGRAAVACGRSAGGRPEYLSGWVNERSGTPIKVGVLGVSGEYCWGKRVQK